MAVVISGGAAVQPFVQPIVEAVVPTQVSGLIAPRLPFVEPPARPDGSILFARDGAIWEWSAGEVHALTPSGGNEQPRWSPDGFGIAYVQRGRGYSDIWVMDASGRE